MARQKARTESRRGPDGPGATSGWRNPRLRLAAWAVGGVVLFGAAVGVAWLWWAGAQERATLRAIEGRKSEDARHVEPGERVIYSSWPPLSGPHDPVATPPGYYSEVQPPEKLVHALEHGNIVIYVDRPDPAVLQTLRKWVDQYPGLWDGVIVTPHSGLGRTIMLTAWKHKLELKEFDTTEAYAFIDRFRGRGPEKPVR